MRRLALAGAVLALAAPATAHADGVTAIADPQPLVDAEVSKLVDLAGAFWRARGVEPVPLRRLYVSTAITKDDGGLACAAASRSAGAIWLDRSCVLDPLHRGDALDRRYACAIVAHEVGHLGGLGHSSTGLMAPLVDATPWFCTQRYRRPKGVH